MVEFSNVQLLDTQTDMLIDLVENTLKQSKILSEMLSYNKVSRRIP